jgi:hypothetical protein
MFCAILGLLAVYFWGKWFDKLETDGIWPLTILFLALNFIWAEFHSGDVLLNWWFVLGPLILDVTFNILDTVVRWFKSLTSNKK